MLRPLCVGFMFDGGLRIYSQRQTCFYAPKVSPRMRCVSPKCETKMPRLSSPGPPHESGAENWKASPSYIDEHYKLFFNLCL